MQSQDTVFGLAYINADDIPELIVAPYGYYCYIFSIYEDEDSLGSPDVVNTVLTFDSDDYNEIGYYEKKSYVYSKHGNDDGIAFGHDYELWTPLDEDETYEFAVLANNRMFDSSANDAWHINRFGIYKTTTFEQFIDLLG